MLELINIREADVCVANKGLLGSYASSQIVNSDGYIDVDKITDIEQKKDFLEQFYENEISNTQYVKRNYQKQKYKTKFTIMLLITGLTLVGAGLFLAPLFIASSIILPIIPVLLGGVALIALTKFYFDTRLHVLETNKLQAESFLNKIMVNKGNNESEVDFRTMVNGSTQELKQTLTQSVLELRNDLNNQIGQLKETNQSFFSSFPKPSQDDPTAFQNSESAANFTRS